MGSVARKDSMKRSSMPTSAAECGSQERKSNDWKPVSDALRSSEARPATVCDATISRDRLLENFRGAAPRQIEDPLV